MAAPARQARALRDLDLAPGAHPRGMRHVGAASGLAIVAGRCFSIADDELHLLSFSADRREPVRLHRLFAGRLPDGTQARKRRKPDLEALLACAPLPAAGASCAVASLVALGSGSRPNRERGARIDIGADGEPLGPARPLDLGPLYAPLRDRFAALNVEGALQVGEAFVLLQRGSGADPRNAAVVYRWPAVAAWLARGGRAPAPLRVDLHALGSLRGVPLSFTDGCALPWGGYAFTAVAEAADDAYADGPFRGSAIGAVDATGRLLGVRPLSRRHKVEGIAFETGRRGGRFAFVTDADDPQRASQLLVSRRFGAGAPAQ